MVYLCDESPLSIVGCCRVLIKFLEDIIKGINGFLHILCLAQKLLSIRTLSDVGVLFSLTKGVRWSDEIW
jgi:hypothetical protein